MKKTFAILSMLLAACAEAPSRQDSLEPIRPAPPPQEEGCETRVADSWIEHACFHSTMGPFRDRSASPSGVDPLVDVSRAHTAFTLELTPAARGFSGAARYLARAPGAYALFTSSDAVLTLIPDGSDDPAASFAAHATELCAELPRVEVLTLEARAHTLHIESDRPSIMLVVEYLDEARAEDSYRLSCPQDTPAPPRLDGGLDQAGLHVDGGAEGEAPDGGAAPSLEGGTQAPEPVGGNPGLDAAQPATADASNGVDASMNSDSGAAADATMEDAEAGAVASDSGDATAGCFVDPVLEHSCLHVSNGPYLAVTATLDATGAPNVNMPHQTYRVQLAGGEQSWLSYRPNQAGEFVFYLSAGTRVQVYGSDGPLPLDFEEPVSACAGIDRAFVFELLAAQRYTVRLGHAAGGTAATLLIESVAALTTSGWARRLEMCE